MKAEKMEPIAGGRFQTVTVWLDGSEHIAIRLDSDDQRQPVDWLYWQDGTLRRVEHSPHMPKKLHAALEAAFREID